MLYLDTCVVLALLTPEVHSQSATAFVKAARLLKLPIPGRA